MCGIIGLASSELIFKADDIYNLLKCIQMRGPDNKQVWISSTRKVAFGHTRLSIQDLSAAGNQPMISSCDRYVITFNGEIYNSQVLLNELRLDTNFSDLRGSSDTEILLEYIAMFGLSKALNVSNGMYAFALFDRKDNVLFLARDKTGEKPLYYSYSSELLMFSSDLSAFKEYKKLNLSIDKQSFNLYSQLNCVPAPRSIYTNVFQLEPAQILAFALNNLQQPLNYSSAFANLFLEQFTNSNHKKSVLQYGEKLDHFHNALINAVRCRLDSSDRPVGIYLSGGYDSSLIASVAASISKQKISTFSIAFKGSINDESVYAKQISNFIGSNHFEFNVTPDIVKSAVEELPYIYSEPFADSSQIPTYILSKFSKSYNSVVLSGDGGDELFGGYYRHFYGSYVWEKLSGLSNSQRKILQFFTYKLHSIFSVLPNRFKKRLSRYELKLLKLRNAISAPDLKHYYFQLLANHGQIDESFFELLTSKNVHFALNNISEIDDTLFQLLLLDQVHYLPNTILTKVDRASMSNAQEVRVPYLDPNVIACSRLFNSEELVSRSFGKIPIKDLTHKYLPTNLMERPKMGFGLPLNEWLKSDLYDWAYDILFNANTCPELYSPRRLMYLWEQHQKGFDRNELKLWNALVFIQWYNCNF